MDHTAHHCTSGYKQQAAGFGPVTWFSTLDQRDIDNASSVQHEADPLQKRHVNQAIIIISRDLHHPHHQSNGHYYQLSIRQIKLGCHKGIATSVVGNMIAMNQSTTPLGPSNPHPGTMYEPALYCHLPKCGFINFLGARHCSNTGTPFGS